MSPETPAQAGAGALSTPGTEMPKRCSQPLAVPRVLQPLPAPLPRRGSQDARCPPAVFQEIRELALTKVETGVSRFPLPASAVFEAPLLLEGGEGGREEKGVVWG